MISTSRLQLKELTLADSGFVMKLFNDPDCIRHIGDKQLHCEQDAIRYLQEGPMAMYQAHGFGLWKVVSQESKEDVGLCGLLQRDYLDAPDIGFAFLPEHRGKGYAREAAEAALNWANQNGINLVCAIVSPDNEGSICLLKALGMNFRKAIVPDGDNRPTHLYS